MRILHTADIHACKEHEAEVMKSLGEINSYIDENPVDLAAIAGDWWDATVQNTAQGGLDRFLGQLQMIADKTPVVMVEGTPSHDVDGSLDVIKRIQSKKGITILEPGVPYFLMAEKVVTRENLFRDASLLILGIPEPRKKYLLVNGTAGKSDTEEAVRAAMHQLCFQLAAIRKQYAYLPCLVVYHGEVAGTTLQNDQTVERGTGIAITIDDLADIGADFYHLGHIHKPQQVGTLPAYYSGSVYAKNFGETHKPGCNLVEIDGSKIYDPGRPINLFSTHITRIDFSHPQNLKIDAKLGDTFDVNEIKGRRVWVELSCTKEEQALVDVDKILSDIMKNGAVPGSRVTVVVKATETVRAAEITGTSITPTKKFEIWAEQSNVEVTESLVSKIKTIEDESEHSGATISGEWALVSVRIRGAIGLWKGIHQDEVFVNFDDFDNGLIALSGRNGKGKTTFIENCHAFPQLLTRKGTLKEHFRLKDSFREVIYRDVSTGRELRFLIQIDGFTKSGGAKYFIFERAGTTSEWTPLPGIDGNLDPYKEAVQAIFGPLELYLRTAFITQRPNKDAPDLTEATKGEKKVLFANLAGIDYLQKFADTAKERADNTAAESHDAEIKIGMLENAVTIKEDVVYDITLLSERLKTLESYVEETKTSGTAAKERVEKLQIAANAEHSRAQRAEEAKSAIVRLGHEKEGLESLIAELKNLVFRKDELAAEIEKYEQNRKIIEKETEKSREVEKRNNAKNTEFRAKIDEFNAKKREIEQKLNEQKLKLQHAESEISRIDSSIELLERDAQAFDENCPKCGQKLPVDKLEELTKERNCALERIKSLQADKDAKLHAIASIRAVLDALRQDLADLEYDEPKQDDDEIFDDTKLKELSSWISGLDIGTLRNDFTKASEAAVRIEGYERQIADKNRLIVEKQGELEELIRNANPDAITDLDLAKTELNSLMDKYRQLTADLASNQASLDAQQKRLAEIENQEAELKTLRESVKTAKIEFAEWDLLKRAFGPDGIQALELDALAPGIAEVANDILTASFGDRFRVEFQTTRIAGTGKKVKQVEDFLIFVIDTQDGESTLLENKSGGEAVWIKRAIYSAFSIIRARNTGFRFLTSFQDESDGALDSASKVAYATMLAAEHETAKLKHTVIITHSEEVKAMIDQKIDMESIASDTGNAGEEVA